MVNAWATENRLVLGQTKVTAKWKGRQTIGLVESERRVNHQTAIEQRYYLLSKEMYAFALLY